MTTVAEVRDFISRMAPPELAEEWDNTGLLVGDASANVQSIMTCLTVTPESASEAIEAGCNLIVPHHPIPFRPLKRIVASDLSGRLLLKLIAARISVISAHTAFDSAREGINESMAQRLGIAQTLALSPVDPADPSAGAGRYGELDQETSFGAWLEHAKAAFQMASIRYCGELHWPARRVAFACGSGGSLLESTARRKCDVMVTGEATYHTCLEARSLGIGLVLLGHHNSERFGMEKMAHMIQAAFPGCTVWCSQKESDPVRSC